MYSSRIVYEPGKTIPISDALNRDREKCMVSDESRDELEVHLVLLMSTNAH